MRSLERIAIIIQAGVLLLSISGCQLLFQPINTGQGSSTRVEVDQTRVVRVVASFAALSLVDELEAAYQARYPDTVFETKTTESSLALSYVQQEQADIAFIVDETSGSISPGSRNVSNQSQLPIIAYDAVVIISSANASIDTLTLEQLRDLYTGQVLTWNQVGGDESRVEFISREAGSITRSFFEHAVMQGRVISTAAVVLPNDEAVKDYVIRNPGAIGYVSMSYVDVRTKAIALNGNLANAETVKSGLYPLVRPIVALIGTNAPNEARQLLALALSDQGCALLARHYICPR
ncbi:MAG: substrate-binding domain-containing protein [Anaerolineae bacterium]